MLIILFCFAGASVEAIDRQFVKYVADNIEPTGWQAVWRASKNSFSTLKQKTDFIVDVSLYIIIILQYTDLQ